MKKKSMCFFLVAGCIAALFLGCSDDGGDGIADLGTLDSPIVVFDGNPRYYSFSTGLEVLNPATADWDIAFFYNRRIYTNSGDTAIKLGSGGNGGVWPKDFSFDAVTSADIASANFTADYATDKAKFTTPSLGGEMGPPEKDSLNFITFLGYGNITSDAASGDTAEDPYSDYQYDQKQFYIADTSTMPPVYTLTNRVYIIRHADGLTYSKIQITAMDSISSTSSGSRRIYKILYSGL
jgi:hypothetical protein